MLYTNYKQIAEINLTSEDAEKNIESQEMIFSALLKPRFDVNNNPIGYGLVEGDIQEVKRDFVIDQFTDILDGENRYSYSIPLPTERIKDIVKEYKFRIDLQNFMTSKVRIAVKSFILVSNLEYGNIPTSWNNEPRNVGNVYIKNLRDPNCYSLDPRLKHTFSLLTMPLLTDNTRNEYEYYNNDILNTSKLIQNTSFRNTEWEIVVDAGIENIVGLPDDCRWSLTLIIYDTEEEENKKAEVRNNFNPLY
jgi:hypothetical protein